MSEGGEHGEHGFGFRTDFYTFAPETLARELHEFEILREVGKGAMGIVYEALRKRDQKRVALKVLPPSLTLTDRALARFVKEGELMSKIQHASIVRVFEHGQKGRLHYFAMEFVDGTTLEERIRIGPLPARDAAELCAQIADALQFAHDRGVVHRDIKPGNIILREDGGVAITDFGLARETGTGSFTESGAIVGTPMYMAPEQILGHRSDVDSRADVYGLGATLFEVLTGVPPFTAPTAQGVLKDVLDKDPPRPVKLRSDLPAELEAITLRALAKQPRHRYGSAKELADDLRRYLAGERVHARLPSPAARLGRALRRHPVFSTLILVLVVLSVVALWVYFDKQQRRIDEMVDQAELDFSRATASQASGFRPPTPEERTMYLNRSRDVATKILDTDDDNYRAWLTRGRVHHRQKNWRAALHDFDRAAAVASMPREDLLTYRIDTLSNIDDADAGARLMADLKALLELDRSSNTLCIVADYMLRFAAAVPPGPERDDILARVEGMLVSITERRGPAAIARAQVLHLRGREDEAREAAAQACLDYSADALVHEEAARIFASQGLVDTARAHASMARLLRGETGEEVPEHRREVGGTLDTSSLRDWLRDLGRLFDDGPRK